MKFKEFGTTYHTIGTICLEDIQKALEDDKEFSDKTSSLDETDLRQIADKMADDYYIQMYWPSLEQIAKSHIERRESK